MRKSKWYLALFLSAAVVLGATGCQQTGTPASNTEEETGKQAEADKTQETDKTKEEQKPEVKDEEKTPETESQDTAESQEPSESEANPDDADAEETLEKTPVESSKAILYIPNANAEGWDVKEVGIEQVTADALIGQLVGQGVLADSVTVQNFEEAEEDGKYVLKLDLSANFRDSILSMGSAGETLTIGALVNSFLDTYGAESISVTVDGGVLESGHTSYEGYLSHINY